MRIGVLTSGGDCPGLNAVIRSVVHRAVVDHGDEVIGFRDGWKGLLECDYLKLDLDAVAGILARGGTILGSSRVQPSHLRDGVERAKGHVEELGLDAIIPIGGEGTLKAARLMSDAGLPVVGVPVPLSRLDGLDSLLSIVQMPAGVPVATVSIGGAKNAGLIAVKILATADDRLRDALAEYAASLAALVEEKNERLKSSR